MWWSKPIPVRLVKEYAYCPRYAYFQVYVSRDYVTPSMEVAREEPEKPVPKFRGWEVVKDVRVYSKRLNLAGIADAVLRRGGEVKVVEFKLLTDISKRSLRGRHRHVLAQALGYGVCAEETFSSTLSGVVVVGRSGYVEVRVTPALRSYLYSVVDGVRRMLVDEEPPPPTPLNPSACGYCRFRDLCQSLMA